MQTATQAATAEDVELDECEFCGGLDGEHHEITTMEYVYPGEPHMAPVGTQTCPNTTE